MSDMSSNFVKRLEREPQQSTILNIKQTLTRGAVLRKQADDVQLTCALVARAYNILSADLFRPTRGEARIAEARQVAMYLTHITFGMSLAAAARRFGRDRTTVAYACRQVEDRRDDDRFDLMLERLELSLAVLVRARSQLPTTKNR
ncbi:MAG: helix-turn-helix domain-containing protein [Parvibaculum sp.]